MPAVKALFFLSIRLQLGGTYRLPECIFVIAVMSKCIKCWVLRLGPNPKGFARTWGLKS